jgi:hypothetical protein
MNVSKVMSLLPEVMVSESEMSGIDGERGGESNALGMGWECGGGKTSGARAEELAEEEDGS